jgi:hypothetical protein
LGSIPQANLRQRRPTGRWLDSAKARDRLRFRCVHRGLEPSTRLSPVALITRRS